MNILAPFSGKFKYNQDFYPEGIYKSPRLILANINWHYNISTDEEYEYCIENYDILLRKKFQLFDYNNKHIVKNQPFWNLKENPTLDNIDLNSSNKNKKEEYPTNRGIELLAWYEAAHFCKSQDYGIHLIPEGIVHVADILIQNCKKYNLNITKRMAVVWSMNILYCHELVHSWIEDIASLIEFSTGIDIYSETQKRYNGYIFMEEALCNTAVYGLQLSFLERDKGKNFEIERKFQAENDDIVYHKNTRSKFNKNKMLKALSDFMKSQPRGYRNFIKINFHPNQSFYFIRGLINLFKYVYECDYRYDFDLAHNLFKAIDLYFGVLTKEALYSKKIGKKDIIFTDCNYNNCINWRDEVPIRLML